MSTNKYLQILPSASYTTTQTYDVTNNECEGGLLVVDMTTVGTGSITPSIRVFGDARANSFPYWTAATAITANSTKGYLFHLTAVDTVAAALGVTERLSVPLPVQFRITITANNANAAVYSVGLYLIV